MCWPLLSLCRQFCIFYGCLKSNPESCRRSPEKLDRIRISRSESRILPDSFWVSDPACLIMNYSTNKNIQSAIKTFTPQHTSIKRNTNMDTESGSLFNFSLVFRLFSKKFRIQLCPPGNQDLAFDERHFLIGCTTVHYLLPDLETLQINAFKSIWPTDSMFQISCRF